MGQVKLVVRRYYSPEEFECSSIKEAAKQALSGLDHDQSFPDYIEENGIKVWSFEEVGLSNLRESLEKLINN